MTVCPAGTTISIELPAGAPDVPLEGGTRIVAFDRAGIPVEARLGPDVTAYTETVPLAQDTDVRPYNPTMTVRCIGPATTTSAPTDLAGAALDPALEPATLPMTGSGYTGLEVLAASLAVIVGVALTALDRRVRRRPA